ncbi:peptidylprolyl isomerase [Halocola ammonii]
MQKWFLLFSIVGCSLLISCNPNGTENSNKDPKQSQENLPEKEEKNPGEEEKRDGLQAKIVTDKGTIIIDLFYNKVPLTVANFVALAEGEMPNSHRETGKPYYDDLTFHRVVKGFIIQGGDPLGNGTGNPGYKFQDEFSPTLNHNKEGMVSMANSGPNTNGSQFFITLKPIPHLNAKHSVFGEVSEGMEVVKAIEQGDKMKSVEIIRKSEEAKNFNAKEIFYKRSFDTYETP